MEIEGATKMPPASERSKHSGDGKNRLVPAGACADTGAMNQSKTRRVPAERRAGTYRLKITLAGVEPPVWRRLLVRGDVGGYEGLLAAIKDPNHEEHESMLEWLGRPFDPEAFDLDRVNRFLQKLKWPRVTDDQLARVLMERDGYRES